MAAGNKKRAKRIRKTPSTARPQGRLARWRKWRLKIFLSALVVLGAYLAFLNFRVIYEFDGKRWSLPARVYARPLELYAGLAFNKEQLRTELTMAGYQENGDPRQPGTFRVLSNSRIQLTSRAFSFWDGSEPSLPIEVQFDREQVVGIRHAVTGISRDLVRLDPALIASIYPSHKEDRILVRLPEVPKLLASGLIAVEDKRFYDHWGIDPRGLARAMWTNMRAGAWVQGGSTLTQQLIKNFYLSNERSGWRKINEAMMALMLESHAGKGEILEAYLNEVFLGQNGRLAIHGFGLGAEFYFGRPLKNLRAHELALLVGLVKGPSYYDPRRHAARALKRRNLVLDVWQQEGLLTPQELKQFRAQPLSVIPKSKAAATNYPAFMDLVRQQLAEDYKPEDLSSEGLRIFTTLAPAIQQEAEQSLKATISQLGRDTLEGAVVITRYDNGELLALVGGKDARFEGFNRALYAKRQIGSLIKPAVYLTALQQGSRYTLATRLEDKPVALTDEKGDVWQPENYDHTLHGEVPLVEALANSYNLATVNLGLSLGVKNVLSTLKKLGVDDSFPAYPAQLLGAMQLSPLQVSKMYQTIASGGFVMPTRAITEVLDANNQPLNRYALDVKQTVGRGEVYLLSRALQETVYRGTAKSLSHYLPKDMGVAGKTGTTNDLRDSWFAGFDGERLGVVWLGNDDNSTANLTGATGAMQVWGRLWSRINAKPLAVNPPDSIKLAFTDLETGFQVKSWCKNAVELPFLAGTEPAFQADCDVDGIRGVMGRTFEWFRGTVR